MAIAKPEPLKLDVKVIEKFLLEHLDFTACLVSFVVLTALDKEGARPAWLKDCAPIHPRTAGPWRGKGSFGYSFGPNKVSHR